MSAPLDCLPDDGIVRLCQLNTVAFYVTVENAQIPRGHHGIAGNPLLLGIGAENCDGMSLGPQSPDEIHSRQCGAVVFLAQHIADNGDDHMQSSFFFLFQWVIMRRKTKHYINNHLWNPPPPDTKTSAPASNCQGGCFAMLPGTG